MAKLQPRIGGRVRCAIYTRKSTEEGLDQAFNSLDAQREACAAYVLSQQHEGWSLLPDRYDDAGFSGGNMDRPGLKQLLIDVKAGKVDVIVVYKVDRLTRALADFAKIVETLDEAQASFVSITQAFNTTSSMGRLTLNVLLSFAQFEREVTSERIRDKVAASKRKGMWMGGPVPFGYDLGNRKLEINETEAANVRLIYERYLALGSIASLARELITRDVRNKLRTFADGRSFGGRHFSVGALAHLLRNPLYIGEVRHKGETFPGEHAPIIERSIWQRVQALMKANGADQRSGARSAEPSLLAGMIKDGESRAMTSSHASKGSRRYRYYVTRPEADRTIPGDSWRVPAGDIEPLVVDRIASWLTDEAAIVAVTGGAQCSTGRSELVSSAANLAERISTMPAGEVRRLLLTTKLIVQLQADRIEIAFNAEAMLNRSADLADGEHRIALCVPAAIVRRGQELRLAFPPKDREAPARVDPKLVELIAKAERAHATLTVEGSSIDAARRAHLTRMARIKFLAPDIVTSILDGRQPASLTARHLLRASTIPLSWSEQREQFGFG